MAALNVPTQLNKAKVFLDSILEKLPEAEREAVRSQYSQAQDELSGISRTIDAAVATVNSTAAAQAEWWKTHPKPTEANPNPNPIAAAVDRDAMMSDVRKELGQTADQLASQGLYLATVIPTIIAQHNAEFGEVLDGEKLIADATAAKMELKQYYSGSVAERRRTVAETKRTAEIAAATETGRLAGLREATSGGPYPVGGHGRPATTLDGLRKPAEGVASQHGLEAAVATVTSEMQKQGQG